MKKYYEDFIVGSSQTFGNYPINKKEIIEYALKWDPQPFHTDEVKAEKSIFKGLTAAGSHIFAISIFLIMQRDVKVQVIAMLGITDLRFRQPARPMDTLSVTHQCIEKRASEKRKDAGIVTNRILLKNQHQEDVLTYTDTVMVKKQHPESL